ncbi:MAG: MarR family transcriptional regulator [Geodermatophilaceae bacterium]|nr:MarR family transcriptional regulator [Geodermatophilaceae bacterium]
MGRTTLDTAALAHDLRLAVMRLSRRLRSQRADTSLTLTQLAALSTLRAKGPLTPGELAAYERVQPPSMTRVLATLEGAGLVARSKHATDGRQVIVQVTDTARALLDDEIRMREAWLAQRMNELKPQERDQLRMASAIIERLLES